LNGGRFEDANKDRCGHASQDEFLTAAESNRTSCPHNPSIWLSRLDVLNGSQTDDELRKMPVQSNFGIKRFTSCESSSSRPFLTPSPAGRLSWDQRTISSAELRNFACFAPWREICFFSFLPPDIERPGSRDVSVEILLLRKRG
jgi:hypothetical protein